MTPTHRIVSLQASNVKVLKAVTITPEGNTIVLTGPNGAGKSSILDAIQMVMEGANAIPERPIRDGTSKGQIVLDLGDLIATRSFTATGSTIKVTDKAGAVQRSPQAILDSLVGRLSFDPLEFSRQKPEVQLVTLRKLVGLDTTGIDAERQTAYSERTVVNRDYETAKNRLTLFPHDPTAPAEIVDVTELTQKLTQAQTHNETNASHRRRAAVIRDGIQTADGILKLAKEGVDDAKADVKRLEMELNNARAAVGVAEATAMDKQLAVEKAVADAISADVACAKLVDQDTQAITGQINSAATVNSKVQANKSHRDQAEIVKAKKAKADELTAKIEKIDKDKAKLLSDCKFPLEGLAIDGEEILFNRLPFKQASTAEKLKVSCAIGIALSPNLKVMFIRDGSLLDKNGLEAIAKMAQETGTQIWIEDARSTDPTALVIEDGEIKSPDPK